MKYLFKCWEEVRKSLSGKNVLLFLDYDGTLTPIVSSPHKALISKDSKSLLRGLSRSPRCKIAVISGRALKDIKNKIGLKNIIYSGNHGLEIEGPRIKFASPVHRSYGVNFKKLKNDLNRRIRPIKGAFVEDKGITLSLHYRLVDKKQIPLVKTIFHEAVIIYLVTRKIRVKAGKMVLEIRPPVDWDKGKVVMWLLAREKFSLKGKKVLPVYIGDDITDEDAFKVLYNRGLTIFVGRPKKSYAKFYLKDTREVSRLLRLILELQKDKLHA